MITLKIQTDNAAFEDNPEYEVARILHALAESVESYGLVDLPAMDFNGNKVGWLRVEEE